ncbi:FAD-dependent oxidoreductase [Variovorax terrae]|uniref:FAD-dependent oxidoreductase n=1 Tax=Variovorax terrae TaxID=2923278 RepID=A0A9X2ARU0_9BURK|nr:FAD-dependent oxidoreductase [Variovorax terrae]MCJ0765907.1 FAD-dependent oxidoreductase [Variovorax terrae]
MTSSTPIHAPSDTTYDVVVLGSGAAGLAAALTASLRGLRTLVVEKAASFGGASAISGGAIWIPGNDQAVSAGLDSSLDSARDYLRHTVGAGFDADLVQTYLERGSEALRFLERNSELSFRVRPFSPDYHPELPGFSTGGRTLEIAEYDGRRLGRHFRHLRKPPEGMLVFGGMMVNRVDIQHFLNASRSLASAWHCAKLLARYARDRLSHPRGTRLTTGNALVARLATSVLARGVPLWLDTQAQSLIVEDGAVRGVVVLHEGREVALRARGGVVLATGGYGAAPEAAQDRPATGQAHWSMSPDSNTGDGLALGRAAGAAAGEHLASNFFWAPVSVLRHADGRIEKFPHLVTDRAKPGIIAINRAGRRFVNEANSYHRFVQAMHDDPAANTPCHLICDATALKAYGMGLARPGPSDNSPLVKAGYLRQANSLPELAQAIGVDLAALHTTVRRYNEQAAQGQDPDFGKGSTPYNLSMGDPNHQPNACLAPLLKAPFYAIELHPGDLGSARGLRTDAQANALGPNGVPVPGLYAAGNDMNSVMDGAYPGPGITLGPALTFGYIAASHIADRLSAA